MKDEAIIELYESRSEAALDESGQAYGKYLHAVAYGILRDRGDAEETVNDALLKAWEAIPPAHPADLKHFLGRITRQLSINRLEQKTAAKRGGGAYALALDELAECIPGSDSGEDVADMIALRDVLNRFLRTLPEEQRNVFIRRYWHMESVAEIASARGISESKVKSMLMRTRNRLRKKLTEEGFFL